MSDDAQRQTDAERGRRDSALSDYSPHRLSPRGGFSPIVRPIVAPRPVETEVAKLNPALLGSRESIDAFADEALRAERNRKAAEADEVFTEGRVHRKAPAPVNYHET